MAHTVELDWEGEAHIRVTWMSGASPAKSRVLDSRDEAEFFANGKVGKRGVIISYLDMTAEQRADHDARKARAKAIADHFKAGAEQ